MNQIGIYTFAVPLDEPEEVLPLWIAYRKGEIAAGFAREFELVAMPPPHAVFERATKLDLIIVGAEDDLNFIFSNSTKSALQDLLSEKGVEKLCSWGTGEGLHGEPARILDALTTGAWPSEPDCLLQAAAFAHHLHAAMTQGGSIVYACPRAASDGVWRPRA